MNIKTKIFISTSTILFLAILFSTFAVLHILNQGIEQQTETLIDDLHVQSWKRIRSGNKILQNSIANYILKVKYVTSNLCHDEMLKEGIICGQWKSIFGQLEVICKRADIDFIVIFDTKGRRLISWPDKIDAEHPETYFKESALFRSFEKYIDDENFIDAPVVSSFEKWSSKVHMGYMADIDDDVGIVVMSAGIIPNDYLDEPVGYVLTGIKSSRLFTVFKEFSKTTDQLSLLADGRTPLLWAGLSGEKNDIKKSLQSLDPDQIKNNISGDFTIEIKYAEEVYHIYPRPLIDYSGTTTVSAAATAIIITGESTRVIVEAGEKIKRQGVDTKNNVMEATLFIAFVVLILAAVLVNIVGRKITKPISLAADTANKIASGDFGHVLDESSSDETGMLSKSMNIMTNNLKDLRAKNESQMKALLESEEKYRLLADNAVDVIWTRDMNFNITYISPSIEKLTGFTIQEAKDVHISERMTPPSIEKTNNAFMEELTLEEQGDADPLRSRFLGLEMICKDGSTVWVEATMNFIRNDDGKAIGILGITRDITERKEAEKALKKSEKKLARLKKMESLGLLAGGVAHDLNNILSGIVSYPELILLDLPEDSKLRKPIQTIQESGYRAADIVKDLLTVARGVATVQEPLDLNTIIKDYLLSPEFKKLEQFHSTVTIKTDLDADLLNVRGSKVHIRKSVMNLVSNASEAVENSGNVIISTMNRYVERPIRGYNDINIGEYAVLSVSDNGPGISSNDLDRIFEPFYTKKVMGRSGTGLGLSVVWNTIQDHNGYIDVSSDKNGTTFELYFPITRDELSDEGLSKPTKIYKGDGETILVVDDVESQREITCTMLNRLGYKTNAVSSGEEAVEYLKEHTTDLILLDMIMDPGISGRETYKRIKKIHPNQKAVIVSGFVEADEVKEIQKLGAVQYIKKPFTLEKIGLAVKEELMK